MSSKTPVAIFAYNRPGHTERLIRSLLQCRRRDECEFIFFADAAKSPSHQRDVDATRAVLRERAPGLSACIVERSENFGLARSIGSGVSELCDSHGRVIVVEDDLVLNPDFLSYMLDALDRYADEAAIMQIAGCTLSPPPGLTTDAFFLPVTSTWGWATWQRAWRHFEWQADGFDALKRDPEWLARFNLGGACNFTQMLEDRIAGRNDSWGILWWYAVSRRRGQVLYPSHSLVWNGGFDGSGVHCGESDLFSAADLDQWMSHSLQHPLRWPPATDADPLHLLQLEDFFRALAAGNVSAPAQPASRLRSGMSRLRRMFSHARP